MEFLPSVHSFFHLDLPHPMCPPNIILRIAGTFILASVALATWVHPAWIGFTAFVGFNMFQSSFTGFCPLERGLGAAGWLGCQRRPVR